MNENMIYIFLYDINSIRSNFFISEDNVKSVAIYQSPSLNSRVTLHRNLCEAGQLYFSNARRACREC